MKLMEAIIATDRLKHNTYTKEQKVAWLSEVDGMVKRLLLDTHEGGGDIPFSGYDSATSEDTRLLVPAPFDRLYLHWLSANIDYCNGEYTRYNNGIAAFNALLQAYEDHYHRTHAPLGGKAFF